jgi:hypothetical protein
MIMGIAGLASRVSAVMFPPLSAAQVAAGRECWDPTSAVARQPALRGRGTPVTKPGPSLQWRARWTMHGAVGIAVAHVPLGA